MVSPAIPGVQLGAELGRGAHSVVLRGTRDGQAFAVKLPLDAGTDAARDHAHQRFLREAVALARVKTPSLPVVMEVGRAGGVPYLIMEVAVGETLTERLARGLLTEEQVLAVARTLGVALDAIHAAGLVHRDVKPDNVVFDPASGQVRLIDLGSASLADGREGLVGTRAYAAPELLSGARLADARTDLYSLGCVLAQCLGKRQPGHEVVGMPKLLSREALLEAGVSETVAEIIARLTAQDPDARYGSAERLLDDLEHLTPGEGPRPERRRARLLGRASELERLRRLWADSRRAGRMVVLAGEAGMGKTRLAQTFLEDTRGAGVTVLGAACHPRDPRSFSALRQLVDGYLKALERLPPTERARGLATVRRLAGNLGPLLKLLSPTVARVFHDSPAIPASENAEQAFAEGLPIFLAKLFRELAPLVVFIDDVQWLDPSSRRALSRVARDLGPRVFLLVGARLGEDAAAVERLVESVAAPVVRLDLAPLSDDDVLELARDYLSAAELGPEVRRTILGLSDGTPLRVLEVLRNLVDEGVLLPHWGEWRLNEDAVARMHLPGHTTSLLRRRIGTLDPETRATLTVAATIGLGFEDDLLTAVVGGDVNAVTAALAEASRSQIVEQAGPHSHRFIHHTVRDALLSDESGLPGIHQRIAEALDARPSSRARPLRFEIEGGLDTDPVAAEQGGHPTVELLDADPLYRLAFHFAAGVPGRTPERLAGSNVQAGRAAIARFDNERAVSFFEAAEGALVANGSALDAEVRLLLAEARLRLGAFDGALAEFRRVIATTADPRVRTSALIKIASLHDMQLDSTRAWEALEQAFEALGEELPRETVHYALGSVRGWLTRRSPLKSSSAVSSNPSRDEMLCALYHQTGRIAVGSGKPARLVLAAMRSLEPAERLGPSVARVKSYQTCGFVLTVLGLPGAGDRYLRLADQMSKELRDPIVYSLALQVQSTIDAWAGRFQDSLDGGAKCLLEYGHWREVGDYILICYNQYEIETIRGRDSEAWQWLDLAIQRVNRHEGAPMVHEMLLLGARAALVGLGRETETERLLNRLASVSMKVPRDSGLYPVTFAPRVAQLTAKMDLGQEFESLVAEFRSLKQDPKRVHIVVVEYYVQVAYARVHACLRSPESERSTAVARLEEAFSDLKAAAKIPPFKAHALAVEGYLHYFEGHLEKAVRAFDDAERLGREETAPWVLHAVHRGRAHMLRAAGLADAAHDQAVLAESVASQHGSVYRARWVREEFGLRPKRGVDASYVTASLLSDGSAYDETASTAPAGARARRQLRALLRISQARAQELAPDHQARLVVDELVQALRAERGFLFLTKGVANVATDPPALDKDSDLEVVAARDAAGRDLGEPDDGDRVAARLVLTTDPGDDAEQPSVRARVGTTPRTSSLSAPLVVDDLTVGVVHLDRPLSEGIFSEADGEVLAALAGQVSVALELTRALRARERAQENLRNAEKMDAVARLARGIAHDLNNMLSAIRLATVAMMSMPGAEDIVAEDVRTIQSALQRANELTKQLGTFSQSGFGTPHLVRIAARIERLLPVIGGLVGDSVRVDARLGARVGSILIDPNQMDQVLMNLAVNARDAMTGGGTMTLETSEVTLDEEYLREHPRVKPGRYVRLSLTDTGHGMEEDVRQKIFEPYFTTKRDRGGTGLGLSSVYWIVAQSGGHIDVKSTVGVGTTITLFFPRVETGTAPGSPGRKKSRKREPHATVLVVEEDAEVARELEETLAGVGYRVLGARTATEALTLARRGDHDDVDLLIADVVMSGMNGLELARELRKLRPALGVLFVSGDTSGVLAARGILGGRVELLPKPVPADELLRRVRAVLLAKKDEKSSPERPS